MRLEAREEMTAEQKMVLVSATISEAVKLADIAADAAVVTAIMVVRW